MQNRFNRYCKDGGLLVDGDRVLVCTSGGLDSMVLLDLMLGVMGRENIGVAHCNFGLRGEESDGDTELVEELCKRNAIVCHSVRFNTMERVKESGKSIQMVARELRYSFFADIAQKTGYTKIAIAHHADDSTETFFINLTRGTGLRGLCGIKEQRNSVIRPLLWATRTQIETYAHKNKIAYRTDQSNFNTQKYLRSKLRHQILPQIAETTPGFMATMTQNIQNLTLAQEFIDYTIEGLRQSIMRGNSIDLIAVKNHPSRKFLLFELLRPYGFAGGEELSKILSTTHSGKQFSSTSHTITIDRNTLIINPISPNTQTTQTTLHKDAPEIEWLDDDLQTLTETLNSTPPNTAILSADTIQFPLTLRRWQHGDRFTPLGMTHQKKISDYLIDIKMPLPQKETQQVLVDANSQIIWLVGQRISDTCKITPTTTTAIRITLIDSRVSMP